ncbi:putative nucleoside-diphosphate-sugar epimerase protein [Botrytis cinerea BcDW1]|nr:putative nucleoside-diphosphate-sugar epimerase protein [Botrytis cinerea BcDW1]
MSQIFFIGATGHIGGAVLDLVYQKYPDVLIHTLVRDEKKGKILVGKYPRVTFVIGDLASLDLLTREAKKADIVINTKTSNDIANEKDQSRYSELRLKLILGLGQSLNIEPFVQHNPLTDPLVDAGPDVKQDVAISAILEGLANHSPKAYYIHTSGASLIWDSPGSAPAEPKIFDDVLDIQALKSFPSTALHATSNALVFAASPSTNIAIISPTAVHGLSPSPLHPTPLSLPPLLSAISTTQSGFTITPTTNLQSHIHVLDLAQIYLSLLSSALHSRSPDPQKWGPEAFYFASSEDLSFSEYMTALISKLSNSPYHLVHDTQIKELPFSEAVTVAGTLTSYLFGIDMQARSTRAKERLGWVLRAKKVEEGLDAVLETYFKQIDDGSGMQELDDTYKLRSFA